MASSNNEGTIFNIEKLDGTNFPFWKEQVFNVLVQKKQIKPIKYEGKNIDTMSQEDWEDMDALTRSTIMLSLSKNMFTISQEQPLAMSYGKSFATCMSKRVWHHKFIG